MAWVFLLRHLSRHEFTDTSNQKVHTFKLTERYDEKNKNIENEVGYRKSRIVHTDLAIL